MKIKNRWNRFSRVDEGPQNLFAVSTPLRDSAWPDEICMTIQRDSYKTIGSYYSAPFIRDSVQSEKLCSMIQSAGARATEHTDYIISQKAQIDIRF